MEKDELFLRHNIPNYYEWDSVDFMDLGWSSDKKYRVTKNNQAFLIRLFPIELLNKKRKEFEFIKKCNELIDCSKAITCSTASNKSTQAYMMLSYIEGESLDIVLNSYTNQEQYQLGIEAGRILKIIHSIDLEPTDNTELLSNLEAKKREQLDRFIKANYTLPHQEKVISFVSKHLNKIREQEVVYQHGDFHPGNMIIDDNQELYIIDFNRCDIGDPYEEFLKIALFTVESSTFFSLGQIDGYFNHHIPDSFWELLKIYSLHSSLFSIVWAEGIGQKEVDGMIERYHRIYSDYNELKNLVPKWVEEARTMLNIRIIPFNLEMLDDVLSMMTNTIQQVNSKDYNQEQIATWSAIDSNKFKDSILNFSFVAVDSNQKICGFINADEEGYIDHLFVHERYQNLGIASLLFKTVENKSKSLSFSTYASITAEPFFKSKGFKNVRKNIATLNGIEFINYFMEKSV
ncbi:MAG: GNAT family N-acetyltransferase [Vagococcus sp.]|uniref:GNAT family N-acetyltransferase n=1 Tax=Vagococcus TaxID=2737 RepID=UPI002FCC749C